MPSNISDEWLKKEKSPFAKISLELKYHTKEIQKLYKLRWEMYKKYLLSKEWKEKRNTLLDMD